MPKKGDKAKKANTANKSQAKHDHTAAKQHVVKESMQLQRTLREVLAGESNATAAAIAASICCPGPFPATRFQDGYDNLPTTLFTPQTIEELQASTADPGDPNGFGLPVTEQWAFAFRDPRRALVHLAQNPDATAWKYYLINGTEGVQSYAVNELITRFTHAEGDGAYKPHGDVLWAGLAIDQSDGYFPLFGADSIVITGCPASTIVQITVDTLDYDGNRTRRTINGLSNASGVGVFTISVCVPLLPSPATWQGYVRLVSCASPLTSPVFSIEGAGPVWAHLSLASFEDVEDMVETFRANGMMLMFSNTANKLYQNGDICGWQVPKSQAYQLVAQKGYRSLVTAPGGSGNYLAEKGLMGFYKPSAATDMQFLAVGSEGTEQASKSYPIVPVSDFLAICANIPTKEGRVGRWTLAVNAEGRAETPWFAHTLDDANTRATCLRALDLVASVPQWHENPLHISDISKALKAGVSWARQHEEPLAEWFDALSEGFPMLQPFRKTFRATQKLLK